jgi:lipopolysaccharide export system permease protein
MRLYPNKLTRYIFGEIISFFLISLFAFTGILLTIRMLKFAALIINKNVGFLQVGLVFISIIPTFLEIAIPLAALIGVMLAYARLSGDSEIVVMRASGINLYQLLKAPLLFGVFCCFLSYAVAHYIRPWGFQTLSETFFSIARAKSTAGLNSGVFNELGVITLYAEEISQDNGSLGKVLIDDKRDAQQRKIITAQTGEIVSDPKAKTIVFHLYDGDVHERIEGAYVVTQFASNSLVLEPDELYGQTGTQDRLRARELYPDKINSLQREIEEKQTLLESGELLSNEDMSPQLAHLMKNEALVAKRFAKKQTQLLVEENLRISMSFASLLLALVAVPLGISPPRMQRTWGAGLSMLVGLSIFMVYYAILTVGITLAEAEVLTPLLAVWLPNIIGALFGWSLIRSFASERWSSFADLFSAGVLPFLGRIIPLRRGYS